MTTKLLQGNEAIGLGAIAAGCRFFAGYPITPSTEIAEILSHELPKVGGKFIQMEDEIASIAAIIGGSIGGLKSMTATSGPGFSLMQENIGYAVMTEVPCVVVNVQRLGPSTGQPTTASQGDVMQTRWGTHGDHPIIVLSPTSVRQAFDLTVKAFYLSEKYRIPVILLTEETIGHMREPVDLPDFDSIEVFERHVSVDPEDYKPYGNEDGDVPQMASFGQGYRYHITGLFHDEHGFPTQRLDEIELWLDRMNRKITNNLDEIVMVETDYQTGSKIGIVAYGATARSARHAMKIARNNGIPVDLLTLLTLWPHPEAQVEALAAKVDRIIVPEMNQGQVASEIERLVGRKKVTRISLSNGEMVTPAMILDAVER
jgi:2-oxoglutarate ferredoxin oxidoreductase subunit alpha